MRFPLEIRLIIARYCDPETILYIAETTGDYDFLFLNTPVELEQLKYITSYIHRHILLIVRDDIPDSGTEKIRQFCFPEKIGNEQKTLANLLIKKSKIIKSVSVYNSKVISYICSGILKFNNLKKILIYLGFVNKYIHDSKHFPNLSKLSCGSNFFENNEIPTGIQDLSILNTVLFSRYFTKIFHLNWLQNLEITIFSHDVNLFLDKIKKLKKLDIHIMKSVLDSDTIHLIVIPECSSIKFDGGSDNTLFSLVGFKDPESLISLHLMLTCFIEKNILANCKNLKNLGLHYDDKFYESGINKLKNLEKLIIEISFSEFARKNFVDYINQSSIVSADFFISPGSGTLELQKIQFTKIRNLTIICYYNNINIISKLEFGKNLEKLYIKVTTNIYNFDVSYTTLHKLKIWANDIDLDTIKLPETLEYLKLNSITMSGTLDLRHLKKLQFLIIKSRNSDFVIKIPDSLFYLNLTPQKPGIVFPNSGIYLTGKYI